jgi:hypothetical protein
MNSSDKRILQNPLTTPVEADDESIIDLVEEIDEPGPSNTMSPLERKLLNIGGEIPGAEAPALKFGSLEDLNFEEGPPQGDTLALEPPSGEAERSPAAGDSDWLFGPGANPHSAEIENAHGASAGGHEEAFGIEDRLLEAESITEADIPAAKATDSESEDDDIELLDIEESEIDDELLWFDDLDKEPPLAEGKIEAEPDAAPLFGADPSLQPESSAADIFSAHVESGLTAAETAIPTVPPLAAGMTAAGLVGSMAPRLPQEPLPPETRWPSGTAGLTDEALDAAVERVLERKLGSTLPSIIRQAVEAAVSKEIQRLKALLLEDDPGERFP